MKVKDLIKILKTVDGDKEVYVINSENGVTYTKDFSVVEGIFKENIYLDKGWDEQNKCSSHLSGAFVKKITKKISFSKLLTIQSHKCIIRM